MRGKTIYKTDSFGNVQRLEYNANGEEIVTRYRK